MKSSLGINLNSSHTFTKDYQPVIHCMVTLTTNYKKKKKKSIKLTNQSEAQVQNTFE